MDGDVLVGNGKSRYTPDEAILMAAWLVLARLNDTL